MDAIEQLEHNLTNHTPDAKAITDIEAIRAEAKNLARSIVELCPESRERSLAITNLEQTVMWAVASIARKQ